MRSRLPSLVRTITQVASTVSDLMNLMKVRNRLYCWWTTLTVQEGANNTLLKWSMRVASSDTQRPVRSHFWNIFSVVHILQILYQIAVQWRSYCSKIFRIKILLYRKYFNSLKTVVCPSICSFLFLSGRPAKTFFGSESPSVVILKKMYIVWTINVIDVNDLLQLEQAKGFSPQCWIWCLF